MDDPTAVAPYGTCTDCPATMADEAEVEAHAAATLTPTPFDRDGYVARSHTVTVTNRAHPLDADEALESVIAFLQRRRADTLRALRACEGTSPDYWRWQGHAEVSRQALELLGADVPD